MEMDLEAVKGFHMRRASRIVASGAFSVALLMAAVVGAFAPCTAQAQNLVQNPLFVDGLNGYQSTGSMIITQTTQTPGVSIAILFPGSLLTQAIQTNINATYLVKFFTSFVNPGTQDDVLFASFGNNGIRLDSAKGDVPGVFSFTATATDSQSILRFNEGSGLTVITALDVEAAPAPVPGAGGLSFLAGLGVLAGLAARRRRHGT
jgi:hypothetical protein